MSDLITKACSLPPKNSDVPAVREQCSLYAHKGTSDMFPVNGEQFPAEVFPCSPDYREGEQGNTASPEGSPEGSPDAPSRQNWIYVIGNADNRLVKIGRTANVAKRIAELQIGSPSPLHLILSVRADAQTETTLHRSLWANRRHGEWFDFGDADPAIEICLAIGAGGAARGQITPHRDHSRSAVDTASYVKALLAAGAPAALGRVRLRSWARANSIPIPGRQEALAAVTAALKSAHANPSSEEEN